MSITFWVMKAHSILSFKSIKASVVIYFRWSTKSSSLSCKSQTLSKSNWPSTTFRNAAIWDSTSPESLSLFSREKCEWQADSSRYTVYSYRLSNFSRYISEKKLRQETDRLILVTNDSRRTISATVTFDTLNRSTCQFRFEPLFG